ncbi:hypothetical protein D3C75_1034160 [compost metagenome]
MSDAAAMPISTGVLTAVASTVLSSGTVSTGFVVSTTLIFCTFVDTFPLTSVAVQMTSVTPKG